MKCEVCGQGPQQGTSVYRINPKGENGRWRCQFHIPADKMPHENVFIDVALIECAAKEGRDVE